MSAALPVAREIRRHAGDDASTGVTLDYAGRLLRRRRLVPHDGRPFLVDLAHTVSVDAGDAFLCDDGRLVRVEAACESLLDVSGADLVRYAWHIGNRHAPCELRDGSLRVLDDPVIARMLERLGARVVPLGAPFTPEGGAYGHGRTHGHRHD